MSKKVVLDTNVIVSAIYTPNGNPANVLKQLFDDEIKLHYNKDILKEYEDVLSRPYLKLDKSKKSRFFEILNQTGIMVNAPASIFSMTDESDRKFYDTAKACDAIIITGNKKHYPDEPFILTPAEFLNKHKN